MTDPLAYIEAAHKHAEQTAQAAGGDDWTTQTHPSDHIAVYDSQRDPVIYDEGRPSGAQMVHIAANSPAAVLRRIAAERKTLAGHRAIECKEFACDCDDCCAACRWTESEERGTEPAWGYPDPHIYPCPTVRNMAEGWGWTGETT